MDFGIFMEFGSRQGVGATEAFRESFDLVDIAEATGLDTAWLAEVHFNPARSVLSAPLVVAGAIATRTKRLRIGMAVHVLPLHHPLRIAEEVATVDQISEGRFDFGIGRSGFNRAYDVYGIPFSESQERFRESLDIILEAWKGEPFSFHGRYHQFEKVTVSPQPYQLPHPPIRLAVRTEETFPVAGQMAYPIFVGLGTVDISELQAHLKTYREAWREARHPGDGDVFLRIPVYAGVTEVGAFEEPRESISTYFNRMGSFFGKSAGPAGTEASELQRQRAQRTAGLSYQQLLETKVAVGTAGQLVERFTQLKEELGLSGIVAELNAGGLIPPEAVQQSLKILTRKVMPAFK